MGVSSGRYSSTTAVVGNSGKGIPPIDTPPDVEAAHEQGIGIRWGNFEGQIEPGLAGL